MKCHKTIIPANSLTQKYLPVDYTDAFACEVTNTKKLSADEMMIVFWTAMPGWANALFKLRNVLVRPFGLVTEEGKDYVEELKEMIHTGSGSAGLMSVTAKSDNETVVFLSDKHLDVYMSVFVEEEGRLQTATAITLVRYHNRLGKIYFSLIGLFHKVIVKSTLKNTLRRIVYL